MTVKNREDPKSSTTAIVGGVGLLLLVISVYVVHGIYYGMERSIEAETQYHRDFLGPREAAVVQEANIDGWGFVDQDRQIVTIPIDQAMKLEAARLQSEKKK